jgi:hypothetical protein
MSDGSEQWWWDLAAGRAVRDDERGPDRDVLGPYPSREAAERWRDRHDAREERWEEQDEEWEGPEGERPSGRS